MGQPSVSAVALGVAGSPPQCAGGLLVIRLLMIIVGIWPPASPFDDAEHLVCLDVCCPAMRQSRNSRLPAACNQVLPYIVLHSSAKIALWLSTGVLCC